MKLNAFKVRNYRCIDETDWINVDDICCIVGKNESGKTSLLRAGLVPHLRDHGYLALYCKNVFHPIDSFATDATAMTAPGLRMEEPVTDVTMTSTHGSARPAQASRNWNTRSESTLSALGPPTRSEPRDRQ